MALLANDIVDLVRGTFPSVRKDTIINLMMPLQEYFALSQLFKKERRGFGGRQIQEELNLSTNGSARWTGLNSTDVFSEKDGVELLTTTIRHSECSYTYDKRTILAQQDNAAKIYDYLKLKRIQAYGDFHKLHESVFWGKPDTDTATLQAYGVFYSLVYSATQGFFGQNPTGFSAVYGNDTTAAKFAQYRNFTGQFTNISSADFLDLFWDAYMKIGFKMPVDLDAFRYGVGRTFACYTTSTNIRALRHMLEGRNENLGFDLSNIDGTITVNRNPVYWVPALDGDATLTANPINSASNPFLMINWDAFNIRFLDGDFMRETGPYEMTPIKHNSIGVHVDLSYQTLNIDRRQCALLAKSDPLA